MRANKLWKYILTVIDFRRIEEHFISASTFNTVIDIGAGMGHLARILSASTRECEVIAVEQNEEVGFSHS